MEIINSGKYKEGPYEKVKCSNCNCQLRIGLEDIREYNKPVKKARLFFDDVYTEKFRYYVRCPECGDFIDISNSTYESLKEITAFVKKGKSVLTAEDRIDIFLSQLERRIHDRNDPLFNHVSAYHLAHFILKECDYNEFEY